MSRREAREPSKLRLLMMERVALSGLDDARKFLPLNLNETYFKLAEDKRWKFERLLSRERYREVKKMQLTWADKMKEEGKKDALFAVTHEQVRSAPGENRVPNTRD
jgi:hypothetical protein